MAPVSFVTGCADCPLCATEVADWGYEQEENVCQHPDTAPLKREVSKRDRDKPAKAPRWCPLRRSALVVRIQPSSPPSNPGDQGPRNG